MPRTSNRSRHELDTRAINSGKPLTTWKGLSLPTAFHSWPPVRKWAQSTTGQPAGLGAARPRRVLVKESSDWKLKRSSYAFNAVQRGVTLASLYMRQKRTVQSGSKRQLFL